MVWVFFWTTGIFILTVKVWFCIIYCDSWISSSVCITLGSSGIWWIRMQGFLSWPVGWSRAGSAAILWVSWWAPMWRWPSMWSDTARMVDLSIWVWASWITSVMSSVVPMVWPRMASVGIMVTLAAVSLKMWLWSGSTAFVPVFVTVAWGWPIGVSMSRMWSVAMCRCTWRWYPVQAIHYYVSIFITLKTSYIRAMACDVTWFLTLETTFLFMRHIIHCWGWYQCGWKLLCGLEPLNFIYNICQSLRSLLIDTGS